MICSIHQPQSFPWLGFFAKIMASDVFIFLDNVQYKKNEFQNRNKIKYNNEAHWLTIPVKYHFGQKINEIEINTAVRWQKKLLNSLQTYYAKSPWFQQYFPDLTRLVNQDYHHLCNFNIAFIRWVLDLLSIKTQILVSSHIFPSEKLEQLPRSEKLMELAESVGATVYLSGQGGKEYLDDEIFIKNRITIRYQDFDHPQYFQSGEIFVSHLSILDLLFNEGEKSTEIIQRGIK
ncbi:MAG: WbqC family protein [Candidatus Marinimicrobia bacterium]|nr:WbqC family protein [Candidatus Neomarinimicrobiota bacterium]